MSTRAYIAGRVRDVGASLRTCLDPPEFILESWDEVRSQIFASLESGEDWRARKLIDEWADLSVQAIVSRLLHLPHETSPRRSCGETSAVPTPLEPDPGVFETAEWPSGRATTSTLGLTTARSSVKETGREAPAPNSAWAPTPSPSIERNA